MKKKIYKFDENDDEKYKAMAEDYTRLLKNMREFVRDTQIQALSNAFKEAQNTISRMVPRIKIELINNLSDSFHEIAKNLALETYKDTINKYFNMFIVHENYKKISFENFNIDSDGTISYEDESIDLRNKDEVKSILEDMNAKIENINNNVSEVKNDVKKPIIIVILLYILTSISGGYLNKVGEDLYTLTTDSFKNYCIERNIDQNNRESKDEFYKKYNIVNASELNVRENPESNSLLVGKLYLNQCVEIIESVPYWTKVRYTNQSKGICVVGWVYTRYLSKFDENTSRYIESDRE